MMEYSFAPAQTLGLCAMSLVLYLSAKTIYRLWLHPLAKFPGPAMAAATTWYEFYYEIVLGGQYTFHVGELHKKYGHIVRISPHELAISDPDFVSVLYTGGNRKRDRWRLPPGQLLIKDTLISTLSHDVHRMRRAAVNPAFSSARLREGMPMMEVQVSALLTKFSQFKEEGQVVVGWRAFVAFTRDAISHYLLGRDYGYIDRLTFKSNNGISADDEDDSDLARLVMGQRARQFPTMAKILDMALMAMPTRWLEKLLPSLIGTEFVAVRDNTKDVEAVKQSKLSKISDTTRPTTIIHDMVHSRLPDQEKITSRLAAEATVTVRAGTHSTAFTIATAVYYLLADPSALLKLKLELEDAIPDHTQSVSIQSLLQLPYLGGVIREALRLSYGSSSRLPRVSPTDPLTYHDGDKAWVIPPGTPVSMNAVHVHHDETIFPDSNQFRPERWIANPQLDRYLLSFSKGSRLCLGYNLAYHLMYLLIAKLFRIYGSTGCRRDGDIGILELYQTSLDDIEIASDGFIPLARNGSHGLKFVIKD